MQYLYSRSIFNLIERYKSSISNDHQSHRRPVTRVCTVHTDIPFPVQYIRSWRILFLPPSSYVMDHPSEKQCITALLSIFQGLSSETKGLTLKKRERERDLNSLNTRQERQDKPYPCQIVKSFVLLILRTL